MRFKVLSFQYSKINIAASVGTLLLILLFTNLTTLFAADQLLTLTDAQRLAVQHSRQLIAQDFSVTAARDMAVAAGQLPDPVLKIGIDNLPVNGAQQFSTTRDFMTMRRVGVMQEITSSDKRELRAESYERAAQKTLAEKNMAATVIERETALAWLERYYAEAMAAVIGEQAEQAKLALQAAKSTYRSGRGSQADIFLARSALVDIDDRASEIQRRIRNAKIMLARWIGDATDLPLANKPATNTIRLDAATLDSTLSHHPQIAVLSRQEEFAETDAKLARANKSSDWNVEFAYLQRGSPYSDMLSIGVSIPLQWNQKNRQDRELSSKLAIVEQAKAERDEALRQHVAETRVMINEWENNTARVARYEQELIPLAVHSTAAMVAAYRGGKSNLADVLAARRNEIDLRLQVLQLQADTDRLWAQLNFLFPSDHGTSQ